MKALAAYIVSGRWQAVLFTTTCGVLSFLLPWMGGMLNYLAAAVVALVTLHVGMIPGLQVLLISTTVTVLFYQLGGVHALIGLVMVLLLWLPCWMAAAVLQQTRNLGQALRATTLFGVCLLLVVYAVYGDPGPWWLQQLQLVETTLEEAGVSFPGLAEPELRQDVSVLLTGVVLASLVVGVIASLLLARWWQSILVHPGGFRDEFYDLRLGYAAGLVTLAVMVMARLTQGIFSEFSAQLAMILLVPYLLVGLAVIHSLLKKNSRGTGWLVAIYVLLAVLPQAMLLLAAGGLMDTWIDFRRRLGRSGGEPGQ